MMDKYMLTTIDNPYDPFTQYDDWYNYDEMVLGYHTCEYLARIALVSDAMTPTEENEELNRAIDEIIANDLFGIYFKKKQDDPLPTA